MTMQTPAQLRQLRRAIAASDPRDHVQVSGEEAAFMLGLTTDQLRDRMDHGDLIDLRPARKAVEALAMRVRAVLCPGRYSAS